MPLAICTFHFKTRRTYEKVAWAMLDTPYMFSVYYGQVHFGKPRCITIWGEAAINKVRSELVSARIAFEELVL